MLSATSSAYYAYLGAAWRSVTRVQILRQSYLRHYYHYYFMLDRAFALYKLILDNLAQVR